MCDKDFLTTSIADNTIRALLDEAIFPTFGKNLKDGSDGDKKEGDGDGLWAAMEAQAAFLGPNIWDKNLTACESDLKYVDLDEFLSENGIPSEQPMTGGPPHQQQPSSPTSATVDGGGEGSSSSGGLRRGNVHPMELHINTSSSSDTKRERSASPYDPPLSPSTLGPPSPTDSTMSFSSGGEFDPRTRTFSDEDLKPQPMIKKSRKQGNYKRDGSKIVDRRDSKKFVPDDLKDEKYWARRRKNNLAAKRSRDARRVKENQIALRAGFLEKENLTLKQEVERLKKENISLRSKLEKSAPKSN